MKDASPQTIYLADYTVPAYHVDSVHLTFQLHPTATRVTSKIAFRPNPESADRAFYLHGEHMKLISARIDGQPVDVSLTPDGLTADVPDAPFIWEAEVEIDPQSNTALEGLYLSNGMFCTQCEAEGFRRITYYPDRPDVMSVFTVRIMSDLPVLLSNGNPTDSGDGWAEWHDPWPKPAYLFALVAGDLVAHSDSFTTSEGRDVALNIYVRADDIDKCAFGMEALKASMVWDERVYGRAYDLDIFNIVAVDDFNMGAMENKGLNIFNSSAVLASPETATDANFERIEAIIAHEYFHNWTGNRITCRDWFQLCLKEGLTVFRDQQFTADTRDPAVARINDVNALRGRQFREDAGPLSHAVRPDSFVEINNFYTATIYEKGAEIIRMLMTILGEEDYYKGLTEYFDRHDGQAVTIEDFFACFGDDDPRLAGFSRWWHQSGTPHVTIEQAWQGSELTLTARQETPPSAQQQHKEALPIPLAVGLIDADGRDLTPTSVLMLNDTTQSWTIDTRTTTPAWRDTNASASDQQNSDASDAPTLSLNRGFAAPIILHADQSENDLLRLMAHDSDTFSAWEAGRTLALNTLGDMARGIKTPSDAYVDAWCLSLRSEDRAPAFRALASALPSTMDIATHLKSQGHTPDPQAIYDARETLSQQFAEAAQDSLQRLFAQHQVTQSYRPDAEQSGKRALCGRILGLITRLDGGAEAAKQHANADNMTSQLTALGCLIGTEHATKSLEAFYQQWAHERLVIDKWFGIQIGQAAPADASKVAKFLTEHEAFNVKNPNRFRATLGALAANTAGFHTAGGSGYALLADWLITLDGINPQTTARMTSAFETWAMWDSARGEKMRVEMKRILSTPNLSSDTTEMITRILG
ncbi:Aminopeptidase N [Nereida ignava]|uniref:Aminopeptidase N n=1 Tax=Nereida ignava TaxID=282199 RepID=A0A0U1NIP9_9RHOB|nr:aminopeptidase N [Nereida ignava]CRK74585.1 Aminopeptidase N [Nereida ignava]SFJ17384.1 aminopeptidase N [Nereida ignava DSM 16309]